ncbi:MAG: polyprenyl synthetase family protein [Oscillospiraceae bacterium]|nr:polyprenyl synthetase family protein [Oscillospiraceae bacterium]
MTNRISQKLNDTAELIERELDRYFFVGDKKYQILFDSVRYSVLGGGKRIRPFLTMEFCKMFGGSEQSALPYACAVEAVHTYSLIHDDLPCMDNDDFRRGKPTNHKVYGENTALLAGDALLTHAFNILAENKYTSAKNIINAVKMLSANAGMYGMVGGQQLDLIGETTKYDLDTLKYQQKLKTGKLIITACVFGCMAAVDDIELKDERIISAVKYGENIGLAFQIVDDILDVGEEEHKTTFLTHMDIENAHKYAAQLTNEACKVIVKYKNNEILCELAAYLLNRKN